MTSHVLKKIAFKLRYVLPLFLFTGHILVTYGYNFRKDKRISEFFRGGWNDAGHYHHIAVKGYYLAGYDRALPVKQKISTNILWFPGYPLILRIVFLLAGNIHIAAPLVNYGLFLACCYLLFFYVFLEYNALAAAFTTFAFTAFPTSFFFQQSFPYALMIVIMLLYLLIQRQVRNRLLREGLSFLLAVYLSLTYPTGFLFFWVPLAGYCRSVYERLVHDMRRDGSRPEKSVLCRAILPMLRKLNYLKLVLITVPFALGVLIFYSYLYFKFGDFFIMNNIQKIQFGRSFANPFLIIGREFFSPGHLIRDYEKFLPFVFFLAIVFFFNVHVRLSHWFYLVAGLLFSPFTGTMLCVYRHYIIFFPIYIVIGTSPRHPLLKTVFLGTVFYLGLKYYYYPYLLGNLM